MRESRTQILLQGVALVQPGAHFGFEEQRLAAKVCLGAIKRGVRIGHQRFRVGAVRRIDRGSDAHAALQAVAFNLEIIHDGREQAFGERRRGLRLRVIHHDKRKLVTAEARDESSLSGHLQTTRDFTQQAVADQMAESVIGLFEVVKVDDHYCKPLVARRGTLDRGIRNTQPVVEGTRGSTDREPRALGDRAFAANYPGPRIPRAHLFDLSGDR